VLASQLRDADGRRTAWAQQYDPLTLRPAPARNFEPIGDAAQESSALALLLMSVPDSTAEIVTAVDGVIAWFQRTALRDLKWVRVPPENRGEVVASPGAPPLWARLYESGTNMPIFGDRDRTIHYDVAEISAERRAGYGWFGTWPAAALERYGAWKKASAR
jgi:PelA/Pel-15E family pectate lyase